MERYRSKLLIVDGYNVLRSGSRYRAFTKENPDYTHDVLNKAREALLGDVIRFADRDTSVVIVFDGAENDSPAPREEVVGGVRIVFSPHAQSADKVIEKIAHDARTRGVETVVVSSDAGVQDTVFGGGVDRMSANGFSHELDLLDTEALDSISHPTQKRTLARRIDAHSLAGLRALRDQLSAQQRP